MRTRSSLLREVGTNVQNGQPPSKETHRVGDRARRCRSDGCWRVLYRRDNSALNCSQLRIRRLGSPLAVRILYFQDRHARQAAGVLSSTLDGRRLLSVIRYVAVMRAVDAPPLISVRRTRIEADRHSVWVVFLFALFSVAHARRTHRIRQKDQWSNARESLILMQIGRRSPRIRVPIRRSLTVCHTTIC